MDAFRSKFKINILEIYRTNYWVWSLRPHQATLGSGILSLRRKCASFSELELHEFSDLNNIIKVIEPTLKKIFNYDIMNYLMLMMVDKQVHYHIIPRYKNEVEFFGDKWSDVFFPGIPTLSGDQLDENKLKSISTFIRENLEVKSMY